MLPVSLRLVGALVVAGIFLPNQVSAAPAQKSVHPKKHAAKAKKHRTRYVRPAPMVAPVAYKPMAAPVTPAPTGWLITLNAKGSVSPDYLGSSRYGAIAFPTLSFRRPGTPVIWSSPDDSLDYAVYETQRFSFGPVLAYRGGRYTDNGGGDLVGIHKSKWTLEPGIFADFWVLPEVIRLHAELRRGFRDEDGFTGMLGADYVAKWNQFTLGVGPRAKFGNDHFLNQQFGITVADSIANPRFKPYKASSGLYAVGAYGSLTYQQSEAWAYTLHGGYDRLTEDAASSPIVRSTGSRNQFSVGAVASYTFQWNGF